MIKIELNKEFYYCFDLPLTMIEEWKSKKVPEGETETM